MADIFVSYASEDRDKVAQIVDLLESAGYSVWWDRNLRGGTVFSKEIEQEIDKSQVVLAIWTANSVESQWVADEVEVGKSAGKLVPISLDGITPPIGFRQIQTIDFLNWHNTPESVPVTTLMQALEAFCKSRPTENAADQSTENPKRAISAASIAVLPFVNMSADPEQEYFSDGLSEELLNLLAKIDHLKVSARTSSFKFKGKEVDIFEVRDALGVAHVLEGSVRKAGNRIRITAQLIETSDGFHLWSETYDRDLDDVFAIQDEISAAIVEALKEILGTGTSSPHVERSDNIEAYDLLLLAREKVKNRTLPSIQEAEKLTDRALEIDPDFVPALSMKVRLVSLQSNDMGGMGTLSIPEFNTRVQPHLDKLRTIAPDSFETYRSLGKFYWHNRQLDKAEEVIKKALTIDPNSVSAATDLDFVELAKGDPEFNPLPSVRKSADLDPLSLVTLGNHSTTCVEFNLFDEARTTADAGWKLAPGTPHPVFRYMEIAECECRYADVLKIAIDNPSALKDAPVLLAYFEAAQILGYGKHIEHLEYRQSLGNYLVLGDMEGASRMMAALEGRDGEFMTYRLDLVRAIYHAKRFDYEKSVEILTPHNPTTQDQWGHHFGVEERLFGAQLMAYALEKVGNAEQSNFFLQKLEAAYEEHKRHQDGVRYYSHMFGALVAMLRGDNSEALDRVDAQIERSINGAVGFKGLPWFDPLREEPRFVAAIAKINEKFESERQRAHDMGLLPISEETVKFWTSLKRLES